MCICNTARKCQVNSRLREACHPFLLREGKNLENMINNVSNVAVKGRPLHNQKKIRNSSGTATCTRMSKVKASPNICSEVLINLGLFESNDAGDIFLKKGSRMPVKVGKQYTAEEVLKTALKKHADNNQFFWFLDDYILCYPDQKVVEFILGTTESFTVEKYKEEFLSKPYSKMDLF